MKSTDCRLWHPRWTRMGPVVLVTCTLLALIYLATRRPAGPAPPWYTLPAPCSLRASVLADLASLALDTHAVLDSLHVPHAACYGTLWGALRQGRVLAWDSNVDLCTMEDYLASVTNWELKEAFIKRGIGLDYDWKTGLYHLRSHRGVEGYVHVFMRTMEGGQEVAVPGGWGRWMWRGLGYRQELSFPSMLLDAPFREEPFHGQTIPVPHDGIELLKFLYPRDWWLVVKPPGCP
ncbi:hypothetical protein ACOMHN_031989 [Nucella lapillus]